MFNGTFYYSGFKRLNAQDATAKINAAALQSGSYMRETPKSYVATNLMGGDIKQYAPEAIFDLSSKLWCSEKNAIFPHVFELELTEAFLIDEFVFDNRCENQVGIGAKEVRIEVAVEASKNPEYKEAGVYSLKEQQVNVFNLDPLEAKLIRISILSNHGNSNYTELAEFKAMGTYKNPDIELIDVDGKWTTNWGEVNFEQSGSSVGGSYVYNNGLIRYGGINRNRVSFKWIEQSRNADGWTLLFMNDEGNRLTGVWCNGDNWSTYGFWIMERKTGQPFITINAAKAVEPNTAESAGSEELTKRDKKMVMEMKSAIERQGKIVLYGINFKTNSAEINPNSYKVLDQIASVMKDEGTMNVRIEGHTDNVGSENYNEKLSLERATATKIYLVSKHHISEDRITVAGMGESMPIADNATEAGKSANRRVEIHRTN